MGRKHTETAFESAIEQNLLASGGYAKGDCEAFDRERCGAPKAFFAFVQERQPKEWEDLKNVQKDKAKEALLDDLYRALNSEYEGSA